MRRPRTTHGVRLTGCVARFVNHAHAEAANLLLQVLREE